mgnify:CR=1 FL=1
MKSVIDLCVTIITLILTFAIIIYFINDYRKSSLSSIKVYIKENLGNIFITLSLLFSLFGFIVMISNLIEFICHLVKNNSGVYNGFAILAFGISLFSIGGSIRQTRKSNEEAAQLKNDINDNFEFISKKIESLNSSRENLHGEIEELKKQNQEIIKLLKENNQKNDCFISRIAKKIKNVRRQSK